MILTENPPTDNPGYDNFDTSGFPVSCTPLTVAPTVTLTIGGVPTTLVDSTHVLDSGGTDAGSCLPDRNESIQWRAIGAPGSDSATLSLGPGAQSAVAGTTVTETATLLDGSGDGIPNATVSFAVTSGPDAGMTGSAVTNAAGQATFTYSGQPGEDEVSATVTTVGSFSSTPVSVLWTTAPSAGWTGSDIGTPVPPGEPVVDRGTGTVSGGGSGLSGTADQFHLLAQPLTGDGGVAARVSSFCRAVRRRAGVMLRLDHRRGRPSTPPSSPRRGHGGARPNRVGAPVTTVEDTAGTVPAYLWVGTTAHHLHLRGR